VGEVERLVSELEYDQAAGKHKKEAEERSRWHWRSGGSLLLMAPLLLAEHPVALWRCGAVALCRQTLMPIRWAVARWIEK
jgi:hypothetical protein